VYNRSTLTATFGFILHQREGMEIVGCTIMEHWRLHSQEDWDQLVVDTKRCTFRIAHVGEDTLLKICHKDTIVPRDLVIRGPWYLK
jgi:hypothetical protein